MTLVSVEAPARRPLERFDAWWWLTRSSPKTSFW